MLKPHQSPFVCKEMHATSQDASHPAEVFHPFCKTGFIFGFRRNGYIDSPQGIHRHQEFGNHHFTMRTFQQTFGQMPEKRIHDIGFPVQTDDNIRSFIFFYRMNNPRSNIQIITAHHRDRYICSSGNHRRFFQITLSL